MTYEWPVALECQALRTKFQGLEGTCEKQNQGRELTIYTGVNPKPYTLNPEIAHRSPARPQARNTLTTGLIAALCDRSCRGLSEVFGSGQLHIPSHKDGPRLS